MSDHCQDCGAAAGTPHDEGCDTARCLQTGYQRLSCLEEHDHGRDVWTGTWPGEAECVEFGWYSVFTETGWRMCEAGTPGAGPDLNRLHKCAEWDREAGRWVKAPWSDAVSAQYAKTLRKDDTGFVQDYLNRGIPVPVGEYYCPDGLVLPAAYIVRARAARREPDAPGDMFLLSEGPAGPGAKITFRAGGYVILSGYVAPPRDGSEAKGDILLGKNDCVITIPCPEPFGIDGMGYGVPVNGGMGTGAMRG